MPAMASSRLRSLGVEISIDDFGTGYSSLAYLQQLGVDELKIDKSFTLGLREPGNATIVRSTIELGHNLGLRVIAEGVEDQWAAALLAEMGCDMLQGYYVGRPGRAAELRLDRPAMGADEAFPRTGSPLRAVPRRRVEQLPIPCPAPAAELALTHQVGR